MWLLHIFPQIYINNYIQTWLTSTKVAWWLGRLKMDLRLHASDHVCSPNPSVFTVTSCGMFIAILSSQLYFQTCLNFQVLTSKHVYRTWYPSHEIVNVCKEECSSLTWIIPAWMRRPYWMNGLATQWKWIDGWIGPRLTRFQSPVCFHWCAIYFTCVRCVHV